MEVLFAGKTELLSNDFFEAFSEGHHNIVFGGKHADRFDKKKVTVFKEENEDGMRQVFTTFNFEKVVFFSQAMDGSVTVFDELEKLEKTLFLCKSHKINQFIYLTTNDLIVDEESKQKETSRQILLSACERLCRIFSEEYNTNFSILKVPYIYSMQPANNRVGKWIKELENTGKLTFRGMAETVVDFVSDADLGELVRRILDEPSSEAFHILEVAGDNTITFGELKESVIKVFPQAEVEFLNNTNCIPQYLKNRIPRVEYGWYAKRVFSDDFEELLQIANTAKKEKRKSYTRKMNLHKLGEKVRVGLEMAVMFVLVELLNIWIDGNALLGFMDFRLVFVVLVGTMNGLTAGIIAALMASAAYVFSNIDSIQWQILFYNVQNWLPFAVYILLGAACGYTRDRHDDESIHSQEEHEILTKKYSFLSDLYAKVLENKETYNSQIIGYRDSFGKLYDIIKRLDKVLPEQIFLEAVSVLEESLDSDSVAIYTVNQNSDFARLNVCSKSLGDDFGRSIQMSKYPSMLKELKEDHVFINLDAIPEYPAYASPVYKNDEMVGMILIKYAKNRQMNMEFGNKFNIITDLIRDSLVRAMEYEERQEKYIKGTLVVETEAFEKILQVKRQMKEKQYMDYTLLCLEKEQMTLAELSELVSKMVRNTDIIGMGEDGKVYLLLSQTSEADLDVISNRMEKNNLNFEVVKG